jgi:hypothetical protein
MVKAMCSTVKEVSPDAIEIKYFLTSYVIEVFVTIENGLPSVTGSFLVCCCTILLVALSNMNLFNFSTFLGL